MRKIKVQFVDFYPGYNKERNFIFSSLKKKYQVEFSDDPDYLFYSCFGDQHLRYDCVKIYWTGEDVSPDFNLCDYAIAFDSMTYGDRYMRLPLFAKGDSIDRLLKAHTFDDDDFKKDRGFCSFVVSNGNANPARAAFYNQLSAYKQVASGGKYMNNIGGPVDDKLEFLRGYKFTIAFENDTSDGYTSEKILDAFLAKTIPIYWGNKRISDDFNPDCFINCHDFPDFGSVVQYVKEVDHSPELYQKILTAPLFRDGAVPYRLTNDAFEEFLYHIIDQPLDQAKRINCFSRRKDYLTTQQEKADFFQLMHHNPVYRVLHKIVK